MKGSSIAATEEVDCVVFGVRKMELHTDDEKVRASIAKDGVATPPSLKMTSEPSEDPAKPPSATAERRLENGLEHGEGIRAAAGEGGRMLTSSEMAALESPQPLSEEALQRSGVFLAVDIPMIDDDEVDEGTPIDDVAPDASNGATNPLSPSNGDAIKIADDKPPNASCNGVASKEVKVVDSPPPTTDEGGASASDSRPAAIAPLKSALKKSRSKAKKGHRVTFHDSRIFYIDTEAETTAEPQLLTVRSLELPLASSDYKVFIPTYDFLPKLPGRSYTYEDAIVSLQRFNDDAKAPTPPVCNSGASEDKSPEVASTVEEVAQELSKTPEDDTDGIAPFIGATEEAPAEPPPLETALDDGQAAEAVQCLTEANLRQHEILMERDDGVAKEESTTSAQPVSSVTPSGVVPAPAPMPVVKNLSPPLKELSVDVSAAAAAGGAASWQVELSPLNSIPESETDDSSASSQDTIIMMTTEESRRNEEHIRESTKSYQQQTGKGVAVELERNGDTASTVSSQDSDETLKCDESVDPGYIPPWTKGTAATLVVNGSGQVTTLGGAPRDSEQQTLSQRTNSQIRQLMERNAVRRSLLRYSNTRKRTTPAPPPEDPPVAAIDRQRQWRSHESLLDTIKQLTVDDEDDDDDDGDYEEIRIHSDDVCNGNVPTYGYANGMNGGLQERTTSNLSLQDMQRLIATPPTAALSLQRQRSQSTTDVDVPGDVRQWKIQATRWDEARRRHQQNGNGYDQASSYQAPPPGADETGDELAQFVQRDSGRIERLRKRYSYSDSGDYETVGAFARRSSVRGIKPRFGSTSEILKQMQSQLQPSPLANGRGHMTWPYPLTDNGASPSNNNRHTMTIRTTVTSRATNAMPSLKEEIYGIVGAHRASYAGDARGPPSAIYAPLPGRSHAAPPPPYQPPPPAPPSCSAPSPSHHLHPHHHHQATQRVYSKDERGVPEGASGSPKAAFDSIYGRTSSVQQQQRSVNGTPSPPSLTNANRHQVPTMADNSGVVYYVMQV